MPRPKFHVLAMPPRLDDFTWEPLESASRLTFTERQRAALVNAMNYYLRDLAQQQETPSMRVVNEYCKRIYKHADPLARLLRLHPTNDTRDNTRQIVLQKVVFSEFGIPIDRESLARTLTHLALNLKVFLHNLRDKGERGRPKHEELRQIILAWHVVYCKAGGEGVGCWWDVHSSQYKGRFLNLLDAALAQAEMTSRGSLPAKIVHPSRLSLARMIKNVIRQKRRSRMKDTK